MSKKDTIKDSIEMIDAKINHIEDMTADNRDIIVKLVKQNNEIVQFLKQIEIENITDDYMDTPISTNNSSGIINTEKVKALLDDFLDKREDLKELEAELKKHKEKLTPGIVGES